MRMQNMNGVQKTVNSKKSNAYVKALPIASGKVNGDLMRIELIPIGEAAAKKDFYTIKDLYGIIPPYMKDSVSRILRGGKYNDPDLENVRGYFAENSHILNILIKSPASSRFTEIVYGTKEGEEGTEAEKIMKRFMFGKEDGELKDIDYWCLGTESCQAVHNRFSAIVSNTKRYVEEFLTDNDGIVIGNFGSGVGRDTMEIAKDPKYGSKVKTDLIDINKKALTTARNLAKHYGIGSQIETVGRSLVSLDGNFRKKYDIGLLIGVLCGLKNSVCVDILESIRENMKDNSVLIMSNASPELETKRPESVNGFRKNVIGWDFVFKNEGKLKEISEIGGFEMIDSFRDEPYGHHAIAIARKK